MQEHHGDVLDLEYPAAAFHVPRPYALSKVFSSALQRNIPRHCSRPNSRPCPRTLFRDCLQRDNYISQCSF